MQNSGQNSVDAALQKKAIHTAIQTNINQTLTPVLQENERLQQDNERLKQQLLQLQQELETKHTRYSTIRQQLQLLTFLTDFEKLTENKKVEDIGCFFSALLNRHPQTAREQIANRGELFYSVNKQEALLIKRDLQQVQRWLYEYGLKKPAKQAEVHIRRLDEKHFNETL